MRLITLLFFSWIPIAYAAPGDEDFCSQFMGKNMPFRDCMTAYDSMPRTQEGDFNDVFSEEPWSPPRFKLPQTFQAGDCIIEVTLAPGVDLAATLWDYHRAAAKRVLDYCVQSIGIGGRVMMDSTWVTVKKQPKAKGGAKMPAQCEKKKASETVRCLLEATKVAIEAEMAMMQFNGHLEELTFRIDSGEFDPKTPVGTDKGKAPLTASNSTASNSTASSSTS